MRVHAMLVGLARARDRQGPSAGPTPVGITAQYLMCVSGPDDAQAHAALGELVFGALEDDTFDVAFPDDGLWVALGVRLHPGFLLGVPVEKPRQAPKVPLARTAELRFQAARPLVGVVVGPKDVPLASVSVRISSLGLSTQTDRSGRFSFACMPQSLDAGDLVILAKGRECRASAIETRGGEEQLVIRVTGLES
jgi:hypothetical protein